MSNQGNRDREQQGDFGQSGNDAAKPAGTSGRNDDRQKGSNDPNRPSGSRPIRHDEDEDSGLGNRTGFR